MATKTMGRPASFTGKTEIFPGQTIPVRAANNIRKIAKTLGQPINKVVGTLFANVNSAASCFDKLATRS